MLSCSIYFPIYLQQAHGSGIASGCVCPGDILNYECTARGIGLTVWTGTAFNCTAGGIALSHTRFLSAAGECGATVARGVSINGNNYTSQLNVTFTPYMAGKIIICLYDNFYNESIQFSTVIPTTGLSLYVQVA